MTRSQPFSGILSQYRFLQGPTRDSEEIEIGDVQIAYEYLISITRIILPGPDANRALSVKNSELCFRIYYWLLSTCRVVDRVAFKVGEAPTQGQLVEETYRSAAHIDRFLLQF